MSLAYGVNGELELLLENNYGDYSDWSRSDLLRNIDLALKSMLGYADDPVEVKRIKEIQKSSGLKNWFANDFIENHEENLNKLKVPKHKHRLETREAYFPKEKKKGSITWCENPECNYRKKVMK